MTYESHRMCNSSESINEGIFSWIFNSFKKIKQRINNTKGGKEIESIYQKYLGMIDKEFERSAKVSLNISAADNMNEKTIKKENFTYNEANETPDDSPGFDPSEKKESDTGVDVKTAITQLKSKKTVLDQIIRKLSTMALKEMDLVLKKYGGSDVNPKLAIIIDSKKDQFELDYMNAQIAFLEKSGDKIQSKLIEKERNAVMKKIEADFKDFDSKKAVVYAVGDEVIYLLKDKTKEEYDPKKSPDDQKDIIGVHKIGKIEGGNFYLIGEDGEQNIVKTSDEIISKKESTGYKVGDKVKYKMQNGTESQATITKVEGDNWSFQGKEKELSKKTSDIVSKVV
jgi:hypothetical protein